MEGIRFCALCIKTIPIVPCPDYFPQVESKKGMVNGLFCFVPSTTMVALQSDCFMWVTLHKFTINGDLRRLGSWSAMQKTKLDSGPAKKCQDFHKQAMCISELANWQWEALELQMSSFKFCDSSSLGVFYPSFNLCVMSHTTFLKTMCQPFLKPQGE